jgi:hypothetical protein
MQPQATHFYTTLTDVTPYRVPIGRSSKRLEIRAPNWPDFPAPLTAVVRKGSCKDNAHSPDALNADVQPTSSIRVIN